MSESVQNASLAVIRYARERSSFGPCKGNLGHALRACVADMSCTHGTRLREPLPRSRARPATAQPAPVSSCATLGAKQFVRAHVARSDIHIESKARLEQTFKSSEATRMVSHHPTTQHRPPEAFERTPHPTCLLHALNHSNSGKTCLPVLALTPPRPSLPAHSSSEAE